MFIEFVKNFLQKYLPTLILELSYYVYAKKYCLQFHQRGKLIIFPLLIGISLFLENFKKYYPKKKFVTVVFENKIVDTGRRRVGRRKKSIQI